MHGAGVVDGIVQKKVAGEVRDYYVMKLPKRSMVVMIPTESSHEIGMRPVMDGKSADHVLEAIPTISAEMTSNWNHRYRENLERIKSGDLMEVARVVKGLTVRDAKRGLSTGERKMLHSAKQILISEIVLSKSLSYEAAEAAVNSALS
jgi:CarD family transcriptional regulator